MSSYTSPTTIANSAIIAAMISCFGGAVGFAASATLAPAAESADLFLAGEPGA